jgi:hypothetical protein
MSSGVIQQSRSLYNANKVVSEFQNDIKLYSETITQISKSPSNETVGIPSMDIAQSAIDVINNEETVRYFGSTYLTIIQQVLLRPKTNVTDITAFAWKCKIINGSSKLL